MADLLTGIAQHLHDLGIVTFDESGTSGDCFLESMPSRPGTAVVLTVYDVAIESDSKLGYDEPRMQVRVRGGPNPSVSRLLCKQIRDELHGLGPVPLPDGTLLILSVALQAAPAALGVNTNGEHEHVCNFRQEIRDVTTHRV
ncbi:minor capsid protein [Streptomyces sp. NPDC059651]|uniref:minor capsid protein n=1 Tax=Streptomyces sp. NPDC059651 TaxID=3346897 RepID=UPI00367E360E